MNELSKRTGRVVLAAAALALVAGCGGGNEDGGSRAASSRPASEVPASALQSPEGLAAFQKSLNNSSTDATSEPLVLGDAALPVSDSAAPVAVN
jgi:hypothetical protein